MKGNTYQKKTNHINYLNNTNLQNTNSYDSPPVYLNNEDINKENSEKAFRKELIIAKAIISEYQEQISTLDKLNDKLQKDYLKSNALVQKLQKKNSELSKKLSQQSEEYLKTKKEDNEHIKTLENDLSKYKFKEKEDTEVVNIKKLKMDEDVFNLRKELKEKEDELNSLKGIEDLNLKDLLEQKEN
ncbi:MAG: hypothetical protein MJ252_22825, partial [archaeon]|nr:hypothetical protein [archaeon]